MHKNSKLIVALIYTVILSYLCLINSSDIPKISNQTNIDKVYHLTAHFIFTVLWIRFFETKYPNKPSVKPALKALLLSFSFGILIEILQGLLTKTRSADFMDVFANVLGSVLAICLLLFLKKYTKS